MIETAKDDNYDLIGQLSTIHVEDPGYYVLKIALSDDLFSQIESADINTVAMYAFAAVMGDANVNASFMVNGLVGTWELLTVSGRKFDKFTMKEFLMVGFLDAGEPFTLFLAKAILSVLTNVYPSAEKETLKHNVMLNENWRLYFRFFFYCREYRNYNTFKKLRV